MFLMEEMARVGAALKPAWKVCCQLRENFVNVLRIVRIL